MIRHPRQSSGTTRAPRALALAAPVVLGLGLILAGCGTKGPLTLPPGQSLTPGHVPIVPVVGVGIQPPAATAKPAPQGTPATPASPDVSTGQSGAPATGATSTSTPSKP